MMGQFLLAQNREIRRRQGGELEIGTPRMQRQLPVAVNGFQGHLGAVGQLAHDIIKGVGRRRDRALSAYLRHHGFGYGQFHVRGGELDDAVAGFHQDIVQNGNGIAAFDDALDMSEGTKEGRAFDGKLHRENRCLFGPPGRTGIGLPGRGRHL